ncbi:hypothetical protein PG999_004105 [Apiospora kogelbergensis]|uniref:Methyltransferase domain-containing protein n=1 Tax=Apiospora kogelbergensis TaxID=1337665 RepID=A0AAW0R5M3_9PEZI
MQPTIGPPHPNVSFVKEDAEEDEWTIPVGFDYVHVRGLHMAVKDHMKLLRNIYKHLAPGGWVEVQEIGLEFESDDGSGAGSALERHCQLVRRGLAALGRDPAALGRYRALLAEAGFAAASLHESVVPMPCSQWPAEPWARYAGHYSALNVCQVARSVTFKLLRAAGVTARGNHRLADEVEREVRSCRVHGHWPLHVIYAQKPWN